MKIEGALLHGEKNAIDARTLAASLGISMRALRAAVERERRRGALILSSDAGYFLPSEDEECAYTELHRFVRRQDARRASNVGCTKAARAALRNKQRGIYGQLELDGVM